MAKIKVTREQVQALVDFCAKHNLKDFFLAKDHGAYIGQSIGAGAEDNRCIYYFPGCHPENDVDWYDRAFADFGGDDFGEHLPLEWLTSALAQPKMKYLELVVTATKIKLNVIA